MFFSQYGPKTVGRCMYFINQYCGLRVAESCTFSDGGVNLLGGNSATMSYDDDGNPFFIFEGPLKDYYTETQIAKQGYAVKGLTI
jgi:hypothetical protein